MGERIRAIDFWRGALQIVILVDHMPGSFLNRATPMNFGFSDALEAFVFLSGVSTGLAYLTMESRFGKLAVAYACARRALKIYGVHVALTLGVFVLFAVAYRTSGVHAFAKLVDLGRDFGTPDRWLAFFALQYQPYLFCVLPLYVALMLWTPIAVVLADIRAMSRLRTRNEPVSSKKLVAAKANRHVCQAALKYLCEPHMPLW